jgi:hypothetical protein
MREIVGRFCETPCSNSGFDTDALQLFFDKTDVAAAFDARDLYF